MKTFSGTNHCSPWGGGLGWRRGSIDWRAVEVVGVTRWTVLAHVLGFWALSFINSALFLSCHQEDEVEGWAGSFHAGSYSSEFLAHDFLCCIIRWFGQKEALKVKPSIWDTPLNSHHNGGHCLVKDCSRCLHFSKIQLHIATLISLMKRLRVSWIFSIERKWLEIIAGYKLLTACPFTFLHTCHLAHVTSGNELRKSFWRLPSWSNSKVWNSTVANMLVSRTAQVLCK